jgi:hypothetical protein
MWPCTAIAEIALNVQEGIYDRLSVQYLNSCGSVVGVGCCEGGNTRDFSRFYNNKDHFIPWSNTNAHWQDNRGQCNTDCSSISTTPNYPISSIRSKTIKIHDISEEEAIENIKNVLHQQKGIYFSFFGNDNFFTHFNNFWKTKTEDYIYNLDWNNGSEYGENGAGHAVLIVGYHDENGSTNDYWIMLNSWGIASKRPNGLFRVNMHMDYDCIIMDEGREYNAFGSETFNISFGSERQTPNPPLIVGFTNGSARSAYFYDFTAEDPQDDDIYYFIDWGDGQTEEWIGPYESGETYEASHSWKRAGSYEIKAKAKDNNGNEGAWATFEVTTPKNKQLTDPFITLLENYPHVFPMLRQLLQL